MGFFCSPQSNEYLLAAEHFGLDRTAILDMCKKGVGSIFGGQHEKVRLHELLREFEAQSL